MRGAWLGSTLAACGLVLGACGQSGSFQVNKRSYNADQITATRLAQPPDGKDGVDVTLKSNPTASVVSDEISVRVTLLWDAAKPPPLNRDIAVSDGALIVLARVACFCGGTEDPFTEPVPSGKIRFSSLDATKGVQGDFDLSFKGQVALVSGGVLYADDTLKAKASGFDAK
jgi:hypothetical protein